MTLTPKYDSRTLFEKIPGSYLVLAPDLTVIAVSDAYLAATMTKRSAVLGQKLFNLFPENPNDRKATGVFSLKDSLNFVLENGLPHELPIEQCNIRRPDGVLEERFWNKVNTPVFNDQNKLLYIIHKVDDVTNRKKVEQQFRALLEAVPDATIIINGKGLIEMTNHQTEILFGYNQQEMTGQPVELLIPEKLRHKHEQHRDSFMKSEKVMAMSAFKELTAVKKDGTIIPVDISLSPIHTDHGVMLSASVRDITQRKEAQEQLELLSRQIDQSNDAIFIIDADNKIKSWNRGAEKLYGFTKDEALGKVSYKLLQSAITEEELSAAFKLIAEQDHWSGEIKRKTKAGKDICVQTSITTIRDSKGTITGYVAVSFDVTEQKKLREKINHLASLAEQSSEAIISIGTDRLILSWNAGAEKLFGYKPSEALGKTATSLGLLRLNNEEIAATLKLVLETGQWKTEIYFYHKDGSSFFGAITANLIKNDQGKKNAIVIVVNDISIRKQLEEQLKWANEELEEKVKARTREIIKSEIKYHKLFENNPMPMWIIDLDTFKFLDVNEMAVQQYGYSREEFLSMTAVDIRPEEEKEAFIRSDHSVDNSGSNYKKGIWNHRKKDGTIIQVEIFVHGILFEGTVARLILANDITEKKKAEEKLNEQNVRVQTISDNLSGLMIFQLAGESYDKRKFTYISNGVTELTGKTPEEVMNDPSILYGMILEEDIPKMIAAETESYRDMSAFNVEVRCRNFNDDIRWLNIISTPRKLNNGQMVWDGFHLDITERKIAEEKIRFDFDLLNAVGQSVIATDTKGIIIYWNNAAEKIYGWSAAEATGQNIIDIFSSKQNKKEATEIVNAIRKGNSWSGEFKVQRKDGTSSPVFVTDTPVYDQKGGLIGIIGVSVDISERKKTEKTIKLMEKKILNQKIQEQKKISRAMIKAQEKERNYIGQELHDNINQILAGTKMYLCIAGKKNEALNQLIKYPVELIDKSIQEIRSLTHKLVTPTKQIDLEVLIRQLLTNLKLGTSIKTDFIYDVTNKFIPDDLKLNIYRIVQEGVINTVKYAEAKNIIIAVKANDKDIHIILADDGKGFKISSKRKGIGISNMINRAETFNGKIQIKSSPGTGCKISVKIPC